ncbi:MAG: hypothetical protein ACKV2T_08125 [Kofleriaceae bacterium]
MKTEPIDLGHDAESCDTSGFTTLDIEALALVDGGINWRYRAYEAMFAVARWNPAMWPAVM